MAWPPPAIPQMSWLGGRSGESAVSCCNCYANLGVALPRAEVSVVLCYAVLGVMCMRAPDGRLLSSSDTLAGDTGHWKRILGRRG